MSEWVVISRKQHAQSRFQPRQGYFHASGQLITPVLLQELPRLVPLYMLGFVLLNERSDEQYQAVALLGVEEGKNLYLNPDGRWLGDYVPASLRGYPFNLLPGDNGEQVLCIDGNALTGEAGPNDLFDDNGDPTETVSAHLNFLNQCSTDRQRTQNAVDALQKAEVITPWPLEINRGEDESPLRVQGLYCIDEKALNSLSGDTYAGLQGAPMALAHAQLFSLNQRRQLIQRARYHANLKGKAPEQEPDIEALFAEEDDSLKFDF